MSDNKPLIPTTDDGKNSFYNIVVPYINRPGKSPWSKCFKAFCFIWLIPKPLLPMNVFVVCYQEIGVWLKPVLIAFVPPVKSGSN